MPPKTKFKEIKSITYEDWGVNEWVIAINDEIVSDAVRNITHARMICEYMNKKLLNK